MNKTLRFFNKSSRKDISLEIKIKKKKKKKARKGSSKANTTDNLVDVKAFQLANSIIDISEILVSLRTLDAKVAEIFNFCDETRSMQVKEDEQLVELTESIQHMFDKLGDFVKYREEKAKLI